MIHLEKTQIADNRFFQSGLILKLKRRFMEEKEKQTNDDMQAELLKSIQEAKNELLLANDNFDLAEDQRLLSMYIYQIKAAEEKLQYLINMAKEQNIRTGCELKYVK